MPVGGLIHEKMGSAVPFSFLKVLFSTSMFSTMKQKAEHKSRRLRIIYNELHSLPAYITASASKLCPTGRDGEHVFNMKWDFKSVRLC